MRRAEQLAPTLHQGGRLCNGIERPGRPYRLEHCKSGVQARTWYDCWKVSSVTPQRYVIPSERLRVACPEERLRRREESAVLSACPERSRGAEGPAPLSG